MAQIDAFLDILVNQNTINADIKNISQTTAMINTFHKNVTNITKNYTNNVKNIIMVTNAIDTMSKKLETADKTAVKANTGFGKISEAFSGVKKAISSISFSSLKNGADYIDNYMNSYNKLARLSDSPQETTSLKSKVFEVANSSNTSYTDMVSAVSDVGSLSAFKTNDEAVNFIEIIQKSLKLDGSSQNLSDVTKSISDGAINGDEFSTLISNAPTIGAAMSSATGRSVSELQKLAEQGMITAEVLKNAMFASKTEISSKFADLPKSFADIWNNIQNCTLQALGLIIEAISNIINSNAFNAVLNIILFGLSTLSAVLQSIINVIIGNWAAIQAILLAIGAFLVLQLISYLTAAIPVLMANVALWWAMYAPIVVLIATIALIIYAIGQMGITFEDIFGFIGGVIGIAIAAIINLFLGLFELILGGLNALINPFIWIANFLGNLFTNPISSIIYLFQGAADIILGIIEKIASAIDLVLGTNMAADITYTRESLKDLADKTVKKYANDENYQKVFEEVNWSVSGLGLERINENDAYNSGSDIGKGIYGNIASIMGGIKNPNNEDDSIYGSKLDPMVVEGTGSRGTVNVNMAEEDTQYLRDLAEREYINKFNTTSLSPNVSITFGDVHETADAEKVSKRIAQILREQIAVAAEGAY